MENTYTEEIDGTRSETWSTLEKFRPGKESLEKFKKNQKEKSQGNQGPLTIVNASEKSCKIKPENVHWICV